MRAEPTASTMPRLRLILGTVIACLAIGGVGTALVALWRPELPDPVATHFTSSGPDGFTSLPWVLAQPLIVAAVCALVATALLLTSIPRVTAQWLVGTSIGLAAGVVTLMVALVNGQRGLSDPAMARMSVWAVLIALVAGIAVGTAAAALVPRWIEPVTPAAGTQPVASLRAGERFVWTGRATSSMPTAALAAVTVLPFTMMGVVMRSWPLLVAAVITLGVAALMWSVRVTVTRTEVSIRSAVGWPRITIAVDDIERAEVVEVNALRDYGGYGYRVGLRGSLKSTKGFVLRSGPALLLVKRSGGGEVVVVDDAQTAAGLVNAVCAAR